ncbi:MAG TPA: hypothetical protein VGM29_00215 [Polyangiaceae bacterium]
MSGKSIGGLFAFCGVLAACHRAEPPGAVRPIGYPNGESSVGAAAAPPSKSPANSTPLASASAVEPSVAEPAPSASAPSAVRDEAADPPLLDDQGQPLPQTDERPSIHTPRFERRMRALADAIQSGEAQGARASFFPLVAYQAVKDVAKPERDYRFRLLAHFERDVKEYRKELGRDAAGATFLGVDVPEAAAKWMAPGSEGNRLGYFRVLRSTLRFKLVDGSQRRLELTSLISWRGEWYVVHLHGFE